MGIITSFKNALIGLRQILDSERNARLHLVAAILALGLGLVFGVSSGELAALFFATMLVFLAEIFNTVLEKTLDLLHPKQSEAVRQIKDMAAGAVLITALGAAIVGVVIYWPYILERLWRR